jgi:hypothetical protein
MLRLPVPVLLLLLLTLLTFSSLGFKHTGW